MEVRGGVGGGGYFYWGVLWVLGELYWGEFYVGRVVFEASCP